MFRLKSSIVVATLLLFIATPAMAEESGIKSIFQDIFYGGLSGALVGTAVLAFAKKPGKHLDFIAYGAAGGAIVGATYGAVSTIRSLAELENGEVKFSMPSIIPELREGPNGSSAIMMTAQLFSGKF